MRRTQRTARGISLIEAVVALAVMAFGMLAYVGLQSSLRFNSDMAKQRSQAVRIAQEAIEEWRAYSAVETNADQTDYFEIVTTAGVDVVGENTTYALVRTVSLDVTNPSAPRMKTLVADVSWQDRNGDPQSVRLSTTIAASPPELAGSLSVPDAGGAPRLPQGRNPVVPRGAVEIAGGKSAFRLPGSATVVWVFNNITGVITSICNFSGDNLSELVEASSCYPEPSWLISGFVRFSPGLNPDATAPTGEQVPLGMRAVAVGAAFADGVCFVAPEQVPKLTYTNYFCRAPQSADTTWTGKTLLRSPFDFEVYDVCRYSNGEAGNVNHPQVYVGLAHPLTNQNFLVVTRGITCPTGTLPHQPPL